MRIDWQNDPSAPTPCHVVNLDTGDVIRYCALADDKTGEYIQYVVKPNGTWVIGPDGRVMIRSGKARIEIRLGMPP